VTRDEIHAKIRHNLDDEGVVYYNHDDIDRAIQDAYDEVVCYCECLDAEIDLPFLPDTTYYDMRALVPDYLRTTRVYDLERKRQLFGSSDRRELYYRANWETITQAPTDFIINGPSYLGFNGRIGTGKFRLNYKAQAPLLEADSVLKINSAYLLLIENYATADLLEQNQEYVKASKYWGQYDPMLEKYRSKIQQLSRADRLYVRGAYPDDYKYTS
jgi:hypothetical protein